MLKRKVSEQLLNWIKTKDRKCLIVQGARQAGKTYAIERFAEKNYEETVEINFKETPSANEIFSGDLTVEAMVMAMRFRFPDNFRAYTTDLSLLAAMKDFFLKQHIVENTLSGNTKGGLYECATADALYKNGYSLYFYKNDTTKKEIDFLIQKEGRVIPIEVKSGSTRANSLTSVIRNKPDIDFGYKFVDSNIGVNEDGIITLPLYMAFFI